MPIPPPSPFQHFRPHPWHGLDPGARCPEVVTAYVEIVPTDGVKYEIDKRSGYLRVDRPQRFSVVCPTLYGFIPRTLGDDGDPLDVLVLMQEAVVPLSLVPAKAIGMLTMTDQGLRDEKIICVALNDPEYRDYTHVDHLPAHRWAELQNFFRDYKKLEGKKVEVENAMSGPEEAKRIVSEALERYAVKKPR